MEEPSLFETYFYNLERSPLRKISALNECSHANLPHNRFHRISAIEGKLLKFEDIKVNVPLKTWNEANSKVRHGHEKHNLGSLGCYLTMIKAWRTFLNNSDLEYAVFMEDDIGLEKDFKRKINDIIRNVPNDNFWDILFFSVLGSEREKVKKSGGHTFVQGPFLGAGCYLMKKSIIPTLISYMVPITMQIDHRLSQLRFDFRIWIMEPLPTFQKGLGSDIQHTPVLGDQFVALKPLIIQSVEKQREDGIRQFFITAIVILYILSIGGIITVLTLKKNKTRTTVKNE